MTAKKKYIVWATWLLLYPIFIYFFIKNGLPIFLEEWHAILFFLSLVLFASRFPIRFRHANIVPLHGISLAIFLQFGLLIEMVVMQLAIIVTLLSLKLSRNEIYRLPINSIVFLLVSFVSGSVFYLMGGITGNFSEISIISMIFPIITYATVYFFLNNWFIFILRKYIVKLKGIKFFDEALAWEAVSAIMIIPIGISLVALYQEIGYLAVLLIGIPLVFLSLFLKLYNESERTGKLLKKVSAFGSEINENLSVNDICSLFVKKVKSIFDVNYVYVFDTLKDGKLQAIEMYTTNNQNNIGLLSGDNISINVSQTGESVLYTEAKQWKPFVNKEHFPHAHSIMSVPSVRNNEIVGVITIVANKKRAFEKSHLMILQIMANYIAVAAQNARNYEKTKKDSERCALTNLFNFRYFENRLLEKYDVPEKDDQFAIILLDLDHFKKINDNYGHQSGNDILCQVAHLLQESVGTSGVLARYGGEEFVVLLEGDTAQYAEDMAETLRQNIESQLFKVSDDLNSGDGKLVRITASIGVATKLENDETGMSVLRNADRAMYTGAKQQGRNKVAYY
ncbi:sensor domain-containing diguanylate cyclase [Evansella cellulosilytica]|uniref:Diguanylate cyclase with GAF sensor n=1 Tax=Evansella cellulosilytica (strain ATCC 21833 / DSM 2522 / FERM P-1141 / JCM 9156 / N-4) TaxID=649639 RepID=E6TZP4_EVAC2|nr:sensor domain-containing diguanylate cyclase [Evansella cellulosilytica]ADU31350.1 diguanylate cyclase with GAF sensor [Evansella cellulosilytica DSM 2522]